MSTYVPAWKGYIADVPQLWFKRCDGNVYHFDELTQASVQPDTNTIDINAGQSLYPVAYLPGQSTMTIDITSGQFDADLFAMANNAQFEDGSIEIPGSASEAIEMYTQEIAQGITVMHIKLHNFLAYKTARVQFSLNGENVGDSIVCSDTQDADSKTSFKNAVAQFFPHDPGQQMGVIMPETGNDVDIQINFNSAPSLPEMPADGGTMEQEGQVSSGKVAKFDNMSAAVGEAVLKWPVYASGDDCSDSAIKGYLIMRMYRARITRMPGFDDSYKNASTFQFQLSAMDAKRDDGKIYELAYNENDL